MSEQLTNLELRAKSRELLGSLVKSNQLQPYVPFASQLSKSKKQPKMDGQAEEILLHQKALQQESEGKSSYREAYQRFLLELHALIIQRVPNPMECFVKDMIGWSSPLFQKHVEKERIDIVNLTKPMAVKDGLYTCPKCKSNKTFFYSRQMRSADEPMTTFITCANNDCQYRWKIN